MLCIICPSVPLSLSLGDDELVHVSPSDQQRHRGFAAIKTGAPQGGVIAHLPAAMLTAPEMLRRG